MRRMFRGLQGYPALLPIIVADYVSIILNMTKKSRKITETYSFTKIPNLPSPFDDNT